MASKQGLAQSLTTHAAVLAEVVASYLEGSLKDSGLSLGAFELLSAVKGSPSGTQAELAANLGITASSLCEAIRSASNKGFVEQESSTTDRRTKRVILTRKGAQALENALILLEEAESTATKGIEPAKVLKAVEVLRQASVNLSKGI
jgi:DNA-binding MarR family transcriptional regulator